MFCLLQHSLFLRGIFFFLLSGVVFGAPTLVHAGGSAPNRYAVAMRNFGIWESETGERLDFSVWYPSRTTSSEAIREGWIVEAAKWGRVLPGLYPVVLVSHDAASGRFANNDLAAALASGGMIVIVPAHTGDNQNGSDDIYTAAILRERPRHLLRALDTVLGSPDFALYVDESRIGLIGVGFGSLSVLQLAGVSPDFERLNGYCGAASALDAFCSPWTQERLSRIPASLQSILASEGEEGLCPSLGRFAPPLMRVAVPQEHNASEDEAVEKKNSWWQRIFGKKDQERDLPDNDNVQSSGTSQAPVEAHNATMILDFQGGPVFGTDSGGIFVHIAMSDSPQFRYSLTQEPTEAMKPDISLPTIDPAVHAYRRFPTIRSIKAIALVAPAGGMLFSRASLSPINVPVAMVEALQDEMYPPGQHAFPYYANLPVQPLLLQLSEADHFSLFASCARETIINLGNICGKLVGDARTSVGRKRDGFLVPFFQSALGGPLPPALPSGYVAREKSGEE